MRPAPHSHRRQGITLLEVIVATAVFLFAISALLRLVSFAEARAVDVRQKNHATALAQSKLGEVLAGIVPLTTEEPQPFDAPDSDYEWSLSANPSSVSSGLYAVTVTVTHRGTNGSAMQVAMSRMVLTPSYRGNIAVPAAPPLDSNTQPSSTPTSTSNNSSSSSSSSSKNSTPTPASPSKSANPPAAAPTPAPASRAPAAPATGGAKMGGGAGTGTGRGATGATGRGTTGRVP